jgi:hypothetical protein
MLTWATISGQKYAIMMTFCPAHLPVICESYVSTYNVMMGNFVWVTLTDHQWQWQTTSMTTSMYTGVHRCSHQLQKPFEGGDQSCTQEYIDALIKNTKKYKKTRAVASFQGCLGFSGNQTLCLSLSRPLSRVYIYSKKALLYPVIYTKFARAWIFFSAVFYPPGRKLTPQGGSAALGGGGFPPPPFSTKSTFFL